MNDEIHVLEKLTTFVPGFPGSPTSTVASAHCSVQCTGKYFPLGAIGVAYEYQTVNQIFDICRSTLANHKKCVAPQYILGVLFYPPVGD